MAVAATAAAAQAIVAGLALGERVHQLAERLSRGGRSVNASCTTRSVDAGLKAATKSLLAAFLGAFPEFAAYRATLVEQAMARQGIITSLAGRRVRSASACQALREAKDSIKGGPLAPVRLAPATLAKLTAELLAEQVCWSAADLQRTACALALRGDDHSSTQGTPCTYDVHLVAATWPEGELLFLLPRQQESGPAPTPQSPPDRDPSGPHAASGHANTSSNSNPDGCVPGGCRRCNSLPQSEHCGRVRWGAGPCGVVLHALHAALTHGVAAQLGLQSPPSVDLAWGAVCDPTAMQPVCCVPSGPGS